jgi:periplasmic divalent cation tolerance protein
LFFPKVQEQLHFMAEAFVIFCTCGSSEEAERLASTLVRERLAACVNIVAGIRSIYRWENKVEDSAEVLLVIKSTGDRLGAIQSRLEALHSYETPELIALPVVAGSERYLSWLKQQTQET